MKDLDGLAKQLRNVAERCTTLAEPGATRGKRELYEGLAHQMSNVAERVDLMTQTAQTEHSHGTYRDREYASQLAALQLAVLSWALTESLDFHASD